MSVVVTVFGGPGDGQVTEVAGAHIEMLELIPGPPNCFAIHTRTHHYKYLRLDSGRMMAVYNGSEVPDYACMIGAQDDQT